jgi:hypothetical protein
MTLFEKVDRFYRDLMNERILDDLEMDTAICETARAVADLKVYLALRKLQDVGIAEEIRDLTK